MSTAQDFDLLIFDFDGTLVDSGDWFRSILPDIARRFRFRCPWDEEIEEMRHVTPPEVMRILEIPPWKLAFISMYARRRTAKAAAYPLFDGVPEVLETAHAKGVKLAVVSSNSETIVRRALGPRLCSRLSACSCGANMFGKVRHFRDVLSELKIVPQRALAVGDETRDIDAAAREVGIRTAAIGWGLGKLPSLEASGPDLCFETVDERG